MPYGIKRVKGVQVKRVDIICQFSVIAKVKYVQLPNEFGAFKIPHMYTFMH